jgi:glycosyltransferase involved in cell wall biosynthesis
MRGVADHLQEGVNALFVPPRDPTVLADTLVRLLANPVLRAQMSRTNREKVKDFAPEKVGRHYLDVLEQVVQRE